jgi:hypothetical protein
MVRDADDEDVWEWPAHQEGKWHVGSEGQWHEVGDGYKDDTPEEDVPSQAFNFMRNSDVDNTTNTAPDAGEEDGWYVDGDDRWHRAGDKSGDSSPEDDLISKTLDHLRNRPGGNMIDAHQDGGYERLIRRLTEDTPAQTDDRTHAVPHGSAPKDNDDNTINHDAITLDYVIADDDLRQAMGTIFAAEGLSTAGALEELAKSGTMLYVGPQLKETSGMIIYKVLTDGVIMQEVSGAMRKPKPSPMGFSVLKTDLLRARGSNLTLDVYIFKHDSPKYYRFQAGFRQLELNNDINAAANYGPQQDHGRIVRA